MSAFGKMLRKTSEGYMAHCPGCNMTHAIPVDANSGPNWTFNGSEEKPTFAPSLLVRHSIVCHSFIREGNWQFLSDCGHDLAGQTVPIPEWTDGDIWDF